MESPSGTMAESGIEGVEAKFPPTLTIFINVIIITLQMSAVSQPEFAHGSNKKRNHLNQKVKKPDYKVAYVQLVAEAAV
ncbi:hypothetical protein L3Q82_024098 [Scortum barcoo]|uniref:Uncharacterized protein n=1 Tax=Scortum barcoo TaxID=214431 RepID=A0ACB8WVE5_9TELE|nr:hypothetical protein L3Q82_024098 [Scortum barcoo]